MNSPEFHSPPGTRIHIDTDFLLQRESALAQVKRKRRTWNESGEEVYRNFIRKLPATKALKPGLKRASKPEAPCWITAKGLVHGVVVSRDPQDEPIRKRLGNLQEPSTPLLLSVLALWLAGKLGISVSVTRPMVAVMLYGVAEAAGDWAVLEGRNEN